MDSFEVILITAFVVAVLGIPVLISAKRGRTRSQQRSRLDERSRLRPTLPKGFVPDGKPTYSSVGRLRERWVATKASHGQKALYRKEDFFPSRPEADI